MSKRPNKRYENLKKYKGIRKDIINNRYMAIKYIDGKEYAQKFDTIPEALRWRNTFSPDLEPDKKSTKKSRVVVQNQPREELLSIENDVGLSFKEVWDLYKTQYVQSLERSTQENILSKENFLRPLMEFKIVAVTPILLDRVIAKSKELSILNKSQRYNFNADLKILSALMNWYRLNYDPAFINPVLPRHRYIGIIKKLKKKNKKMSPEEVVNFFNNLPPFWKDFAEVHFYMASRVAEVAGLQVKSINLADKFLVVKYVTVWDRAKKFVHLKEYPKNGEERIVHINDRLSEIFSRRIKEQGNGYLFHEDGNPLGYRKIQYHYNRALKLAGLYPKYSSTHIMRHSMGTITRRVTGSLDFAQAVTGHKDIKMIQHYASLPSQANVQAINEVSDFMKTVEDIKENIKK